MKTIFLIFIFIPTSLYAQSYPKFHVYKQMSSGVFNLFDLQLVTLDKLNNQADIQIEIPGREQSAKTMGCQTSFTQKSPSYPKGMEEYQCRDLDNLKKPTGPTRHFQFTPGISQSFHGVGTMTNWKDQGQHSTVEYKQL